MKDVQKEELNNASDCRGCWQREAIEMQDGVKKNFSSQAFAVEEDTLEQQNGTEDSPLARIDTTADQHGRVDEGGHKRIEDETNFI